jgi:U4/U6 small nuclear ribonucleoprotein PRP4
MSLPNAAVSGSNHVEVLELTADSLRERLKHEAMLLDLEAKKRAFAVDVPTLPHDVRDALRNLGLPVRLFGENLANVRDRLRMELARRQVLEEQLGAAARASSTTKTPGGQQRKTTPDDETKYTRASAELIVAREEISVFSLECAQKRLSLERQRRLAAKRKRSQLTATTTSSSARLIAPANAMEQEEDEYIKEITQIDDDCIKLYKTVRNFALEGSQYGDDHRPLSALCTSLGNSDDHTNASITPLIVTGSWSGTIKVWDGSSPQMELRGTKTLAHDDRIMGIAIQELNDDQQSRMVATSSIDLTAKLWKVQSSDHNMVMGDDERNNDERANNGYVINEVAHLKGHAARLCRVAFHPMKKHVITTSFDHTWRLWDIESGQEILLQDGHWKQTFGVGFHPDGSLCATTDFGSVVQVWDLRTGKSICHFLGHAKRVLCAEFSPNGFQLATAGDDGTIKIWDLRRRKQAASIPAHCNLISQLRFDRHRQGECLASASFDGTAKLWSTRDWKMLATLRGHEGKVVGVDWLREGMVTSGFDKTLKIWR